MSDPVLIPSTPTVNQGDTPETIAQVSKSFQEAFDKVSPAIRGTPTPKPEPVPRPELEKQAAPVKEPEPEKTAEPDKGKETPAEKTEEHIKVPSFIDEVLKVEPSKAEPQTEIIEEWPEELPQEEKKNRIKGLRDAYKQAKEEIKVLKSKPQQDESTLQKIKFLEDENKSMRGIVERVSVEAHPEFQNRIIRPMHAAWNEAARVVKDLGGNPQDLQKALTLSGKAQFEALDTLMEGMPESAKVEVNNAISNFRRFDQARRDAIQKAPQTLEALKQADERKLYTSLSQQKEQMASMYDNAIKKLRDEAKIEILQKSSDPDAKEWNELGERIVQQGKSLFLDNTDLEKMAYACAIAPAADVYRKLWLNERDRANKAETTLKDKFGSEPSLSESGGHPSNGKMSFEDELKLPIGKVFINKVHELEAQRR